MPRTAISQPDHPRAFPLLWGGTASANFADGVVIAVAPLLAATITREPALVAGLVVAQRLPWMFVLFAGVVVDRFDRRVLLVVGNALRVVAVGGVMLGLILGVRELWILYAAALLIGLAETVVDNASLAILPQLIRRERIPDANGRIFATQSILNELAGPPLGAAVFALSATAAFATGSGLYLLAVIFYFLLPRQLRSSPSAVAGQSVWTSLGQGIREFLRIRILVVMAVSASVINLSTSAAGGVLVLYTQDRLGLQDIGYGVLLAAGAVGGIPAGIWGPAIVRRVGEGLVWVSSTAIAGLSYLVAAFSTSPWLVGVMFAATGFTFTLGNVIAISVRQTAIPNELLGRVTSVYRLLAVGVMPLGALVGGLLATFLGITAPFWFAGGLMLILAIVTAPIVRTSRIRALTAGADGGEPEAPPVSGASSE